MRLRALVVGLGLATGVLVMPGQVSADPATPSFRVLDTRQTRTTPLPSGSETCVPVVNRNGVPGGAEAVTVNITAVQNTGTGYVTAYGYRLGRPGTSSLNFSGVNENRSNDAIVEVGSSGSICLYNNGATHLILDVTGYFMASDYAAIPPVRLADTRPANQATPTAGSTTCFPVLNAIPSPAGPVSAVFINVTAVQPQANGYLTVHGKNLPRPGTSTVNFRSGANSAVGTIASVGDGGQTCVYVNGTTDLIIDLVGYFPLSSSLSMLNVPFRAADTRQTGRLSAGGVVCTQVVGRGGVPWGATQVFATVTLVNPSEQAFGTAYPEGFPVPETSAVNAPARENRSNGTWLQIGARGRACVKVSKSSDVLIDVWGLVNSTSATGPAFVPGALAYQYRSSNTSSCNYAPGSGPFLRSGALNPQDWVYSAQEVGSLPVAGGAARTHYYKLYSHTAYSEYENCLNNQRWIQRYHRTPVTACARLSFPTSFPVGLPSVWTYYAGFTPNYLLRSDYRPCPNV